MQRATLVALGYPHPDHALSWRDESVKKLVVWLEHTKIRQYAAGDRAALNQTDSPTWYQTFDQYLQDLECPLPFSKGQLHEVLDWLLAFAVHLEFTDHAKQYNAPLAKAAAASADGGQAASSLPLPDALSPQVQQQLGVLLQALAVDTSQGCLASHLQAARQLLQDSVLPSCSSRASPGRLTAPWQHIPLGFTTADESVDAAASLLRLLYIADLRQLQTWVDQLIVQVQEFTANPKTDASLGKVGT